MPCSGEVEVSPAVACCRLTGLPGQVPEALESIWPLPRAGPLLPIALSSTSEPEDADEELLTVSCPCLIALMGLAASLEVGKPEI